MDLNRPLAVVTPTLDGDVLCILARAEAEFTPSRVHGLLKHRSEEGIRKVLMRLTEQGIVLRRKAGPSYLYSFNRAHLSAPAVVWLCDAKQQLISSLHDHVGAWTTPPIYGALFGSATRWDMRSDSDLDIFLVRPDDCAVDSWTEDTMRLAQDATNWTGNDARVLDLAEQEIAAAPRHEGILASIRRDALPFWGSHERLVAATNV